MMASKKADSFGDSEVLFMLSSSFERKNIMNLPKVDLRRFVWEIRNLLGTNVSELRTRNEI